MLFRRLSLLAVLLTLGLGTTTAALANSFSDFNTPSDRILAQKQKKEGRDQFLEQLNLSEDQKRQLKDIQQKYKQQMSQYRDSLKSARKELQDMMVGNSSKEAIRAKHNEVAKLRQTIADMSFESMLEMREVMTPEQRQQFARLMEERVARWRNRMQERGAQRQR